MKVVNATWFTQLGAPGIMGLVKVPREYGDGFEFFIGTASGDDEELDAQHIAETGARFLPNLIANFIESGAVMYRPV